jgi:hypothetical protein
MEEGNAGNFHGAETQLGGILISKISGRTAIAPFFNKFLNSLQQNVTQTPAKEHGLNNISHPHGKGLACGRVAFGLRQALLPEC